MKQPAIPQYKLNEVETVLNNVITALSTHTRPTRLKNTDEQLSFGGRQSKAFP